MEKDWKLKLRYGTITTPYKHYTVIAKGVVGELKEGFECRPGKAYMSMKVWAVSTEEAADMIKVIGENIGFMVTSRIEVFDTAPIQAPRENPYGYDILFVPFQRD